MFANPTREIADPARPSDERGSSVNLDTLISEAAKTIRAILALGSASRTSEDPERVALPESQLTSEYLYGTLTGRLGALGDIASFEPAQTPRQALFQLMLAIPCIEIVKCTGFDRDVTLATQRELESMIEKAVRLVWSAVAGLADDADHDLAAVRQRFCERADDPVAETHKILSLV